GGVCGGRGGGVARGGAGGGGPAAAGGGPFAVCHGLYWLTANLSAVRSLALLVDDLHWGDPPSLTAVEYLGRRLEGLPVLLVIASRPPEPGFDRSVLDALGREPAARQVAPRALREAAPTRPGRARPAAPAHACCRP